MEKAEKKQPIDTI